MEESQKHEFDRAWKCLLSSYQEHAERISKERGMGICIYKFIKYPRKDKSNCEFWYTDYKSREWTRIINLIKHDKRLSTEPISPEKYFICVQIPVGERGDRYLSDIREFSFDETIKIIKNEKLKNPKSIRRRKIKI